MKFKIYQRQMWYNGESYGFITSENQKLLGNQFAEAYHLLNLYCIYTWLSLCVVELLPHSFWDTCTLICIQFRFLGFSTCMHTTWCLTLFVSEIYNSIIALSRDFTICSMHYALCYMLVWYIFVVIAMSSVFSYAKKPEWNIVKKKNWTKEITRIIK